MAPSQTHPLIHLWWIQPNVIDLIGFLFCSEVNKNLVFNVWVLGSIEVAIDSLKSLAPKMIDMAILQIREV